MDVIIFYWITISVSADLQHKATKIESLILLRLSDEFSPA